MSETETSNDDLFRGFFTGMDDLIDVVPGQSTDVFSSSLISTKSGTCVVNQIYGLEIDRNNNITYSSYVEMDLYKSRHLILARVYCAFP
jgi:hypothetical protein